jgi:hypothetical protein
MVAGDEADIVKTPILLPEVINEELMVWMRTAGCRPSKN